MSSAQRSTFRLGFKSFVVAMVLLASGCEVRCGNPGTASTAPTAGHNPMAQSGPEVWQIGERKYEISSTYYLALPEGLQFTIDYPYTFSTSPSELTEEQALQAAMPLMRYAYETGVYNRSRISKLGAGRQEPTRIGVALIERKGAAQRGKRVALDIDAIEARISSPPP